MKIRKCAKCGETISGDSPFCHNCGAQRRRCPHCFNGFLDAGMKFCDKCGKPYPEEEQKHEKKKIFTGLTFFFAIVFIGILLVFAYEKKPLAENAKRNFVDLQWSLKAENKMSWEEAEAYCKNLNEAGYSDWRLPTVSELRSLIQNCPSTQSGGSCGITDTCLSSSLCKNKACNGCEDNNDVQYSKLGDKGFFWSSSLLDGNDNKAWYVDFNYASIHGHSDKKKQVRCVRW